MTGSHVHTERLPASTMRHLAMLALLVALAMGALQWGRLAPLRQIDSFFYDSFIALGAGAVAQSPVVLVSIDDASLAEVGQWPWPRYKLAQLLSAINDAKPSAVAMDVIFPEPDRTGLSTLSEAYRKEFGLDLDLENIPRALLDNDAYLGAVMADSGAVGAVSLLFDHTSSGAIRQEAPKGVHLDGLAGQLQLEQAQGVLQNTFRIQSQLKFDGFINMQPDYDGELRRIPLLLRFQDRVYPHLMLAALMRAAGTDTVTVARDRLGLLLQVGAYSIPVGADGTMLLRYRHSAQAYRTIPALDVLRSGLPAQVGAGRLVFIGSSASALHDQVNAPVDTQFPGLEVYAAGLGNILAHQTMREPAWSGEAALVTSLLCGGVVAALFVYSSSLTVMLLGSAALLVLVVAASGWLAIRGGIYLSPSAQAATILACFTLLSVARFAIEKRRAFRWLEQVNNTQRVTIESMAAVAETRDPETGGHIKRTQNYVRALAEELAREGKYPGLLTPEYIELLYLSAPLHDIGKVGVRDDVLLKPGRLDEGEFHKMKQHARYGEEIIAATSKGIQGENFLRIAAEIAGYHHEKWDGSGYPYGLAGEAIPLSARLMAVADVYDALISRRCYKPPFPHRTARNVLLKRRGAHFDPAVVDAFFAIEDEILAIARRFADEHVAAETEPAV
jgi:HD-GYP domain-containing protein (c-di-GMP phosphodiesterase class II)